jgi:transcriptional regulator with XRE-family HTH domain
MSMPMATESPDGESLNPEQAAFAQRLRDARERKRLSIETIAASMNIPVSLLDALERGDIRRWPAGIFRRAFFRGYVSALGFDSEPLLRDFLQVFPENPPLTAETATSRWEPGRLLAASRIWASGTARRIDTAMTSVCAVLTGFVAEERYVQFWNGSRIRRYGAGMANSATSRSQRLRLTWAAGRTWTAAAARELGTAVVDVCGVVRGLVTNTGYIHFRRVCGLMRGRSVATDGAASRSATLPLTLAEGRTWSVAAAARRVRTAAVDVSGVVIIGGLVAQTEYIGFWAVCSIVGATYYMVSSAAVGGSAIGWWIERRAIKRRPRPATLDRLRIASPRTRTRRRTKQAERSTPYPSCESPVKTLAPRPLHHSGDRQGPFEL